MNKYTAEDIVSIVNSKLSNENISYADSRISRELTTRRLRDYIYKGLVSSPVRDGRNIVFTDDHLEEIYKVRLMNLSGYSDSVIRKEVEIQKTKDTGDEEDSSEEESIENMISSMKKQSGVLTQPNTRIPSSVSSYLRSSLQKETQVKENDVEHYISEDGKTYIKLDRRKVQQITDEEVEDAVKNCVVKIDLTNE
jgi:DNA-binding transcriptional MerR regulator